MPTQAFLKGDCTHSMDTLPEGYMGGTQRRFSFHGGSDALPKRLSYLFFVFIILSSRVYGKTVKAAQIC